MVAIGGTASITQSESIEAEYAPQYTSCTYSESDPSCYVTPEAILEYCLNEGYYTAAQCMAGQRPALMGAEVEFVIGGTWSGSELLGATGLERWYSCPTASNCQGSSPTCAYPYSGCAATYTFPTDFNECEIFGPLGSVTYGYSVSQCSVYTGTASVGAYFVSDQYFGEGGACYGNGMGTLNCSGVGFEVVSSPIPTPEFPLGSVLALALSLSVVFVYAFARSKANPIRSVP
jgi:hypothetical protein